MLARMINLIATLRTFFCIQVAVVPDNRSMNKLPKIEGLLSYRSDDSKLYLKEKAQWRELATQKQVSSTEK